MTFNEFKLITLEKLNTVTDNALFELESLILSITGMKKSDLLLNRRSNRNLRG